MCILCSTNEEDGGVVGTFPLTLYFETPEARQSVLDGVKLEATEWKIKAYKL
jgi:hypothetical protein